MEPSALDEAGGLPGRVQQACAAAAMHAAAVDAEARFPAESFAAIKAQRLLGILLPIELGGEGASISQVADVCYQLGQVCASTAMIFAMHQIKTACILRHRRANRMLESLLRRLCAEQLLLASSTTEGQSGGNLRSSEAPVEYQGDRISLERRASVISYGAYADGIVTTARRSADAAGTDQVLVVLMKSDYTLTRLQGWDTMGMRGTCSDGYVLKATGSIDQIVPDPYEVIHPQTLVPMAHLLGDPYGPGSQRAPPSALRHLSAGLPARPAVSCRRVPRSSPKSCLRCGHCARCLAMPCECTSAT